MNVFMLQDTQTGLFYRRRHRSWDCWVEQKQASIWINRVGPASAMTVVNRFKNSTPCIRTFTLEPFNE